MKRFILTNLMIMFIGLLSFTNLFAAESCFVYGEDFDSIISPAKDIGYTSFDNDYAHWVMQQDGYYYVNTKNDNESKYWAYSPDFGTVNIYKNVTIRFDVLFENQTQGIHPGVRLTYERPDSINIPYVLQVENVYKNIAVKAQKPIGSYYPDNYGLIDMNIPVIGIYDKHGNKYYTPRISDNIWYRIEITYHADNTADIEVTNLENDTSIYKVEDVDFILEQFRYLAVGYYSNSEITTQEWSPIKLDNVYIFSGDTERCDYRYTKNDLKKEKNEGIEEGKKICKENPAACGISVSPATSECAAFNNSKLHVPCFQFSDKKYWLDLTLKKTNPVTFELTGYGEKQ